MKKPILEAIKKRRLFFDGATGSVLQMRGLPAGLSPEKWNLSNPDEIVKLHMEYLNAGADIIKTNTFGVNPFKFENYIEVITAAVTLAKRAVGEFEDKYIAFDVGPLGRLLSPLGDLDFEDALSAFRDTVAVASDIGVDLILIETMNDSYETKAAVLAAKEVCDLPIFVTNVYDAAGKLMTGADPAAMIAMLEGLGVSAIGMNCSLGPDKMLELMPVFASRSSLPIIVNPNAGLPELRDGKTVYNVDKLTFAKEMRKMAKSGAAVLGGCCGTTPNYISELVKATKEVPYIYPGEKNLTTVSSYTHAVDFGSSPVLIGERINPTGKPKLKEAIRSGNVDYILTEALGEADKGAHILDVNVGLPEIDEPAVMREVVLAVQSVTDTPLQLDSSDPDALCSAMRIYNGKPLVNSVNGKSESMNAVFPLVKKYGGTLIALTIDESGIPDTAEGRVAVAERIITEAARHGIGKKDIIVDPLALSVSADKNAAKITLESIRLLTERGIKTSLGVSNISFGLPARDKVNSAFFTSALTLGLSAAIMNPYSEPMMDSYHAYKSLAGLDEGCTEYIAANADKSAPVSQKAFDISLTYAIRRGMKDAAKSLAEMSLSKNDPLDVINNEIIPALNEVGAAFEAGKAYLPELLMSAEAAGAAFDKVKEKMPKRQSDGKGVILATVKGDIHDIGKNIVKVLLESYGFTVYDLGRDVAPDRVLDAVRKYNCKLVGLSALMTTTVPSMKETIELLRKEDSGASVIVGGAVLTAEYAEMIGADFYGADAMESVRIAEKFYGKES